LGINVRHSIGISNDVYGVGVYLTISPIGKQPTED